MSEKRLRGHTLGRLSFESEEGVEFAPRTIATYRTEAGEEFTIPFGADAELPFEWVSPHTGQVGRRLDAKGKPVQGIDPNAPAPTPPTVTHWEQLMKRRSVEELEILLAERIAILRESRGESTSGLKKTA